MPSDDPSAWSPRNLVEHLIATGGRLVVVDPEPPRRAALRRLVHAAKRDGHIPAASHLRHTGRDRGDFIIELVPGAHPDTAYREARTARVEVPVEPVRLHPAVMTLLEHLAPPNPLQEAGTRAQAILHAIAIEAERRGHRVEADPVDGSTLVVTVGDWPFPIKLVAGSTVTGRLPTVAELDQQRHYDWERIRPTAAPGPPDRLEIELPDEYLSRGRRRRWADRVRWRLEDKLGEVLAELEARAALCDERRDAEALAAASLHQQWEEAMARARERFADTYRRDVLREQVAAWTEARDIRAYCDALERAAARAGDTRADLALTDWLAWCRTFASSRDPLTELKVVPDIPEPGPEELWPFLGRWSPYGAEASY